MFVKDLFFVVATLLRSSSAGLRSAEEQEQTKTEENI